MGEIKRDHFMLPAERVCSIREHSPILEAFVAVRNDDQALGLTPCRKMRAAQHGIFSGGQFEITVHRADLLSLIRDNLTVHL
ncbi:hypothetical protein D3C75_1244090 [compost metagenome]